MDIGLLTDETIWGLPNARFAPALPDADSFAARPIAERLRAGAGLRPDAIALVGQSGSLRYAELMRLVARAAHAVAALVRPGQPVACILPRTPEGIAGLLGCLLSGRLVMVLDPSHPAQRQMALLADAAPAALVLAEPLPFACDAPVLRLADALSGPDRDWPTAPAHDPDAPLAVYFTSGSSGQPKGIVLSARAVMYRSLDNMSTTVRGPDDRFYGPAVPNTGSSLTGLLAALFHGARVVLSSMAQEGAAAVLRLIEREAVTCAVIQPPLMRLLFQSDRAATAFRQLRVVRIGGAALTRADLAAWRPHLPPGCDVWHTLGSTEAPFVTGWVVPPDDTGPEPTVASGLLNPDHDYALLGPDDRPVPPGEPGEVTLRSRFLVCGEWRQGRLVAGRLLPVPGRPPGWRVFRTGDVARIQPDGLMRVLGRADRQVKVNGIRVEPAEIEAVLLAEPGVTDAAVVAAAGGASGGAAGGEQGVVLHGFVVAAGAEEAVLIKALRQRLAAALPNALRPSRLTVLERMPTLPSGKVDVMSLSRGG